MKNVGETLLQIIFIVASFILIMLLSLGISWNFEQIKTPEFWVKVASQTTLVTIVFNFVYALDKNYPERYLTPGGSNFKIRYEEQDAVLAVPIAEMYGTKVHPQLGRKRIPLRIELLSPAMRPVQVTRDLPNFWLTNWSYVRKEMKQRYIKHFWPEDPANALPGRSIRR